jgi:hypothetical protein
MSDEEDGGLEEQLRVAAEYGQGLLRLNEKLQRDNAALRLEIADGAAQYDARMRQQETMLVEPLQRRVEELEDTVRMCTRLNLRIQLMRPGPTLAGHDRGGDEAGTAESAGRERRTVGKARWHR